MKINVKLDRGLASRHENTVKCPGAAAVYGDALYEDATATEERVRFEYVGVSEQVVMIEMSCTRCGGYEDEVGRV